MAIIIANWKMNKGLVGSLELASSLRDKIISRPIKCEVVLCPSFPYLTDIANIIHNTSIALGAQDCSNAAFGAFTGDVSAAQIADTGCHYVIVGHSERRVSHHETSAQVKQKAAMAHNCGLTVIICVGETAEQKQNGDTFKVIGEQVIESLPISAHAKNVIIAYEPVWAIGTGNNPSLEDISEAHAHIRKTVKDFANKNGISFEKDARIVYGGSVKSSNCKDILSLPLVDGLLVGGASLVSDEFYNILEQTR